MDVDHLLHLGSFSKGISTKITSIAVDSRLVQPGSIFFALPGEKVDGHQFLQEAWKKGAAGAVIRQDFLGEIPPAMPVMRVKEPLATLQKFAQMYIAANGAKIFAITGSVGKTTTKDFAHTIVSQGYKVVATPASNNSQIGLGLSLLNALRGKEEWIIAEMGMTHFGDLLNLTEIAPPDMAIVTKVCLVHAENFSSLEEIAKAKSEIFANSKTSLCLYNADTAHAEILGRAAANRGKSFSMKDKNAFWFMQVLKDGLIVQEDGKEIPLPLPDFPAPHVYENLLAAIVASRCIGVSWDHVCSAIPYLRLPALRLEHVVCKGIHFINDSINACEPSMMAALDVLKETPGTRKIAVLGAMKELGTFSAECHKNVWDRACEVADCIFSLGQEWKPMVDQRKSNKYLLASSFEELIELLEKNLKEGDTVLLKGSRWANQLWRVVDHFQGKL